MESPTIWTKVWFDHFDEKVKRRIFRGVIVFTLLILLVFIAGSSRIDIPTNGDARIWVRLPGRFSSFYESTYKVFYRPKSGAEGAVSFRADFEVQPIVVICPTNDGRIFCLYDMDVVFRLIKIDTTKSFQGFRPQSPLNWIVRASSFNVEQGNNADWNVALDYLDHMTEQDFRRQSMPVLNFGVVQIRAKRQSLLGNVHRQADAMFQMNGSKTTMPLFNND